MNRQEKLLSRGFKDEKHLEDFLANCIDEAWKKELTEYYSDKKVEKPKTEKTSKDEEVKNEN